MATVIDVASYVELKRRLPVEAFFIDTNIVIAAIDPFGASLDEPYKTKYTEIQPVLQMLRSAQQVKCFYSSIVAWEYYSHIRWMFFKTQNQGVKFSTGQFKALREASAEFLHGWEGQLKAFNKAFGKRFVFFEPSAYSKDWFKAYSGTEVDLGDAMIVHQVMGASESQRCVFSNDGDFLKFDEQFYLLTTNRKIIEDARKKGNLF